MGRGAEEVDADDDEAPLERAAAIDVAKASGKVWVRLPHPSGQGRRLTRVWDAAAATKDPPLNRSRVI